MLIPNLQENIGNRSQDSLGDDDDRRFRFLTGENVSFSGCATPSDSQNERKELMPSLIVADSERNLEDASL